MPKQPNKLTLQKKSREKMKGGCRTHNSGVGVKGLVLKDSRFLVLAKHNGCLDLPGGKMEIDESIIESLEREIIEETKLSVAIIGPVAHWSFLKKSEFQIKGFTYFCRYLEGAVELSLEHNIYFWANIEEIQKLDFHPSYGLDQISQETIGRWQEYDRFWSLPQIK
jgi:8-oxo-dGTP pyrophosphatase MutT (NUDIX family)